MPGRCGGCRMVPLDCRVAALLAMTKGRTGMGEVGSVLLFGCVPQRCHCEPGRAWQSGLLTVMSLRGRSRRELTWQSSLRRYAGGRGDAVGCRMVPLDYRVGALPLLAMTTGGNLRRSGFACLAWPGSALSQGPLRSVLYCRLGRHPSVRNSLNGWPVGDRGGSPGSRRCRRALSSSETRNGRRTP